MTAIPVTEHYRQTDRQTERQTTDIGHIFNKHLSQQKSETIYIYTYLSVRNGALLEKEF
jgi:hypothetical protein